MCIHCLNRFQAAIKNYGVPQEEIFQTADLFERRNVPQVTLCLYALARLVSIQLLATNYSMQYLRINLLFPISFL